MPIRLNVCYYRRINQLLNRVDSLDFENLEYRTVILITSLRSERCLLLLAVEVE